MKKSSVTNVNDIKVCGVCQCTVCGATAHLMKWGQYQCADNEHHVADVNTGIFTDLQPPVYEKKPMEGIVMKPVGPYDNLGDLVYKKVMKANKAWVKDKTPMLFVDYQDDFVLPKEKFNIPAEASKQLHDLMEKHKDLLVSPKWDGMSHSHEKVVIHPPKVEKPKEFIPLLPAPKSRWGMKMKELLKTA